MTVMSNDWGTDNKEDWMYILAGSGPRGFSAKVIA